MSAPQIPVWKMDKLWAILEEQTRQAEAVNRARIANGTPVFRTEAAPEFYVPGER
jgi:hypothetical protein